jgi:hypothetical protein
LSNDCNRIGSAVSAQQRASLRNDLWRNVNKAAHYRCRDSLRSVVYVLVLGRLRDRQRDDPIIETGDSLI